MANHCPSRQANLAFTSAQNHTAIKAILPFVRTPTSYIKFTAEHSPFAPTVKQGRKDVAADDARRDPASQRANENMIAKLTLMPN